MSAAPVRCRSCSATCLSCSCAPCPRCDGRCPTCDRAALHDVFTEFIPLVEPNDVNAMQDTTSARPPPAIPDEPPATSRALWTVIGFVAAGVVAAAAAVLFAAGAVLAGERPE